MENGIEFKLNKKQAEYIKDLRVYKGYSWRAVARDMSAEFPELGISGNKEENWGSQFDGIALCNAAMKLLNEKTEDGWN